MCSRFTLRDPGRLAAGPEQVLADDDRCGPRFNIAPGENVLCLVRNNLGDLRAERLHWGLIPPWAENEAQVACHTVDYSSAGAETISAHAWRKRRCLLVADGFYLWKRRGPVRNPFFFELPGSALFFLAGVWESWTNPASRETIKSVAVVTRPAAGAAARVSASMPVAFAADSTKWLDPLLDQPPEVEGLVGESLVEFEGLRVSRWVNDPANESSKCIAALG